MKFAEQNFRNMSKMFAKVKQKCFKRIVKEKLLNLHQCGFRENCFGPITEITEVLQQAVEKHYRLAAFIDFKKAFDTVYDADVMKHLNSLGFRDQIEQMLRD